jgi:hypothetical protein
MRTVPSHCVATAVAMLVRSLGNAGQQAPDFTVGIFPPMSSWIW